MYILSGMIAYIIQRNGGLPNMKHLKKLATTLNKNCLSFIATLALFVTYNGVNTACWFVMNQDELPKGSKKLRNF